MILNIFHVPVGHLIIYSFHFYHVVEEDDMDFLKLDSLCRFLEYIAGSETTLTGILFADNTPWVLKKGNLQTKSWPNKSTRNSHSSLMMVLDYFEQINTLWKWLAALESWKPHWSTGFRESWQGILGSWVRRKMILQCLSALNWRSLLISACVINNIIASVQLDSVNGTSEAHSI